MPCDDPCDGDCACEGPSGGVSRETVPDVEPVEPAEVDEECEACAPGKGCRSPVGPFVRHMVRAWAAGLGLDGDKLAEQDDEFYRLWFKGILLLASDASRFVELQHKPLEIGEKIRLVKEQHEESSENLYYLLRLSAPFVKRSDDSLYLYLLLLQLHGRHAPAESPDDLHIPEWAFDRMVELGHLMVDDGGKEVSQA